MIDGRLLGDGGLSLNAPVEPILGEFARTDGRVIVADLFARDGERPNGLQAALARKNALMYGNQTWYRLEAYRRLRLRDLDDGHAAPSILYLSYLPVRGEAGAEMPYDFSPASTRDRWAEGFLDGRHAVAQWRQGKVSAGNNTAVRGPVTTRTTLAA